MHTDNKESVHVLTLGSQKTDGTNPQIYKYSCI